MKAISELNTAGRVHVKLVTAVTEYVICLVIRLISLIKYLNFV